ncbi:MAG: hypothetical protein ACPGTP_05610 [Bacteroidia bacterium]
MSDEDDCKLQFMKTYSKSAIRLLLLFLFVIGNLTSSAQSTNIAIGLSHSKFSSQTTWVHRNVQTNENTIRTFGIVCQPSITYRIDSLLHCKWSTYIDVGFYNNENKNILSNVEIPVIGEIHIGNHNRFQLFAGGGIVFATYSPFSYDSGLVGPQGSGGVEFNYKNQRCKLRYSYTKGLLSNIRERGIIFTNNYGDYRTQNVISVLVYVNYK